MARARREAAVRAFTECARVYEECMGFIGHPVIALDSEKGEGTKTVRPAWKPRAEDFVADFSLACFAVAARLSSKAEQVLHLRFVRLLPAVKVVAMTGLNGDCRNVLEEIYVQGGLEMMERKLWPIRKYFA